MNLITPRRAAWLAALCLLATGAHAQDTWTGPDKREHLLVSSGIGIVASGLSESKWKAWGGCMAIGAGKELADAAGLGTASAKDLVADAIGCGAGVAFGRQIAIYSRERGVQFIYRVEF